MDLHKLRMSVARDGKQYAISPHDTSERASLASPSNSETACPKSFERWHDMMDALQRLNVSDASVLDALYERGFTYLAATQANAGFSQEELREPAASMFERMNADPVFANPAIPPSGKRLFAQLRGLPCPTNLGKLPYLRTLATEGLYSLKNLGPPTPSPPCETFCESQSDAKEPLSQLRITTRNYHPSRTIQPSSMVRRSGSKDTPAFTTRLSPASQGIA